MTDPVSPNPRQRDNELLERVDKFYERIPSVPPPVVLLVAHLTDAWREAVAEVESLRAFRDRVLAIASNERADWHSIGWAIVSLADEEHDRDRS